MLNLNYQEESAYSCSHHQTKLFHLEQLARMRGYNYGDQQLAAGLPNNFLSQQLNSLSSTQMRIS